MGVPIPTATKMRALDMLHDGQSQRAIARELGVSPKVVRNWRSSADVQAEWRLRRERGQPAPQSAPQQTRGAAPVQYISHSAAAIPDASLIVCDPALLVRLAAHIGDGLFVRRGTVYDFGLTARACGVAADMSSWVSASRTSHGEAGARARATIDYLETIAAQAIGSARALLREADPGRESYRLWLERCDRPPDPGAEGDGDHPCAPYSDAALWDALGVDCPQGW